ncbi:hypothetical protein DVH05_009495 [Phytophthora capsici]|nr:hypothetical protein DVH05_009495 [Phytophthora capsici]
MAVARLWRATQVELQGEYSIQRVQDLFQYHDQANNVRVLLVLLMTPLPCFLVITIVDLLPLRPISEGIHSSLLFFIRVFVCFWVASMQALWQIHHTVPPAPLSNVKIVVYGAIVAALTDVVMYSLTLAIGYPLPFGIVTVSPAVDDVDESAEDHGLPGIPHLHLPNVLLPFYDDPRQREDGIFTCATDNEAGLRGAMAKTVNHLKDELSLVIVVNVDLFSALFSTYCMQSSPSVKTTCVLMAADILQICLSLYDIEIVVQRMRALKKQREVVKVQGKRQSSTSEPDVLGSTRRIERDARSSAPSLFALLQESKRRLSRSVRPTGIFPKQPRKKRGLLRKIAPMLAEFGHGTVTNEEHIETSIRQQYVRELQKVLYIAEFVVLVNYLEVVIPLIFSAYLFTMYHLPNRAYYAQINGMDETRLRVALFNIAALCIPSIGFYYR